MHHIFSTCWLTAFGSFQVLGKLSSKAKYKQNVFTPIHNTIPHTKSIRPCGVIWNISLRRWRRRWNRRWARRWSFQWTRRFCGRIRSNRTITPGANWRVSNQNNNLTQNKQKKCLWRHQKVRNFLWLLQTWFELPKMCKSSLLYAKVFLLFVMIGAIHVNTMSSVKDPSTAWSACGPNSSVASRKKTNNFNQSLVKKQIHQSSQGTNL